jgi:hypothetical protein
MQQDTPWSWPGPRPRPGHEGRPSAHSFGRKPAGRQGEAGRVVLYVRRAEHRGRDAGLPGTSF